MHTGHQRPVCRPRCKGYKGLCGTAVALLLGTEVFGVKISIGDIRAGDKWMVLRLYELGRGNKEERRDVQGLQTRRRL